MMTGVKRYAASFFISLTKVMPSMLGMLTSLMTRFTFLPSSLVSASRPSQASITSYPAPFRAMLTTCRNEAESSTMRMVFFMLSFLEESDLRGVAGTLLAACVVVALFHGGVGCAQVFQPGLR